MTHGETWLSMRARYTCRDKADRPGLGLAQLRTQYRRLDRHLSRQQCAVGPRAIPSEPARRPGDPIERPISGYIAPDDELFRGPRQRAAQAHQQAIQWIGQQLQAQASYLGYMDVFWVLMLIALVAVPLALTLRKVKLGAAAMGH
jgi:hypothetical protein